MTENHVVVYLYRDAGNYKFWGEFVVSGRLSKHDLEPLMLDNEFFVPERVGIQSLVPKIKNSDDHLLHEIVSIEKADDQPAAVSAAEVLERFRRANTSGWF